MSAHIFFGLLSKQLQWILYWVDPPINRTPFVKGTLKSWSGAEITHHTYLQGAEISILYLP